MWFLLMITDDMIQSGTSPQSFINYRGRNARLHHFVEVEI